MTYKTRLAELEQLINHPTEGAAIGSAQYSADANDGAGAWLDQSDGSTVSNAALRQQARIEASGAAGLIAIARPNATEEEKFLVSIAEGADLPGQGTRWEQRIAETAHASDPAEARKSALIAICAENVSWLSHLLFEELHHQAETPTPITVEEWNDLVDYGQVLLVGPFEPGGPLDGHLERLPEPSEPRVNPPSSPTLVQSKPSASTETGSSSDLPGAAVTSGPPGVAETSGPIGGTGPSDEAPPPPPSQFGVKVNDVEQPVPAKLAKPEHEEFFLAIAHKIRHGIQVGWEEIEAGFHKLL